MYHKIEECSDDELTVSRENLEKQLQFLQKENYKSIFFKEIDILQPKRIILTFDDGYKNNYKFLPELLKKYNHKAVIFVNTKFIEEETEHYNVMSYDELRDLDQNHFEIGLHSHSHRNFSQISIEEAKQDLVTNMHFLDKENIPYSKIFAYPYGRYKKEDNFFSMLKEVGINYALRIGNKINYLPTKKPYEICRIDIKGSDNLLKFKLKLIFGKLKF